MLEQVSLFCGEIASQYAVTMKRYLSVEWFLMKKKIRNALAHIDIEKKLQTKAGKNEEIFAISAFKVNNSQQIEQFNDLMIKLKYVQEVYTCRDGINRENMEQKDRRFCSLYVAQKLVG